MIFLFKILLLIIRNKIIPERNPGIVQNGTVSRSSALNYYDRSITTTQLFANATVIGELSNAYPEGVKPVKDLNSLMKCD